MYILILTYVLNGTVHIQQISPPLDHEVCIFAMTHAVVGDINHSGSVNCIPEGTIKNIPWSAKPMWESR